MALNDRYKTGQKSPANAYYQWDGYTDGTRSPLPTSEEMKIKLANGSVFPPINSVDKGAYWVMTSYA